MVTEGQCQRCGKRFEADNRRAKTKKFCSSHCRYESWRDKQEQELIERYEGLMQVVKRMARRGAK